MDEKTKEVIKLARSLVGRPYKYGAKTDEAPECFDCSMFIQYLFGQVGITIPRSTIEQAEFAGEEVKGIDNLEPGDLIFIKGDRGHYNPKFPDGIGHVSMYLGERMVIHAVSKRIQHQPEIIEVGSVKIEPLENIVSELNPPVIVKRVRS